MLPRLIPEMDPLDDLLKGYANEALPKLPAKFDAGVWAEIERRRAHRGISLLGWADPFLQPMAVAAALLIAVLAGFTSTFLHEHPESQQQLARQSLHLDVFSVHSVTLRASLFQSSALTHIPR